MCDYLTVLHVVSVLRLFGTNAMATNSGDLEIIRDDLKDGDAFSEDPSDVFSTVFNPVEAKAFGLDDTYVLHINLASDRSQLFVALSDGSILNVDPSSLTEKSRAPKNSETVTGLRSSPLDPSLAFSCSLDGNVRLHDFRDGSHKAGKIFSSQSGKYPSKPLTSFDASTGGRLLCAGTEQVKHDAFLLFWDVRQDGAALGGYWDSHEDDVTAVAFNPGAGDVLASAGTDGIVNVFDVSATCEDDALATSINTESSVQVRRTIFAFKLN